MKNRFRGGQTRDRFYSFLRLHINSVAKMDIETLIKQPERIFYPVLKKCVDRRRLLFILQLQ